jgi:hypothetical protein
MRSKNLLFLTICFGWTYAVFAQTPAFSEGLKNSGFVSGPARHFEKTALWGYMNGGADLWLEYGFEDLWVWEGEMDSTEIKVEIFRMKDAAMARGVFSLKCGGISRESWAGPLLIHPYQVQMVLDEYYISLINYRGDQKGRKACVKAADGIQGLFGAQLHRPPHGMPADSLDYQYLQGPLGLSNAFKSLEKVVEGVETYQIWFHRGKETPKARILATEADILRIRQSVLKTEGFSIQDEQSTKLDILWKKTQGTETENGFWESP